MLKTNPQRLAWITMIGGLAVFCLLSVSLVLLTRWFIFESPTPLTVTLHVGRGTVGLAEPDTDEKAVRSYAPVGQGNTLRTDNVSQGYLAVSDPYSGEVIVTVMLRNDSEVTLKSANRPRFSLSDNPYVIRLTGAEGNLEVWVNSDLERDIYLELRASTGIVYIKEPGNFLIDSTPESLVTHARVGSVTLLNFEGQAQYLAMSTLGSIQQGSSVIHVSDGPADLLPNWNFDQATDWPVDWGCTWDPSRDNQEGPQGAWIFSKVSGRGAIHITRLQTNPGPGTTRCVQFPGGPEGLDVSQYANVHLRVTMQAHHQSLNVCGEQGSECPVMLKLTYVDQDGNSRVWYHGFYIADTPNLGGRKICDGCLEEHELINEDAWYTYESVNLLTDWPEGLRPSRITEVQFYADGHQYDMMLSEVALVATLP